MSGSRIIYTCIFNGRDYLREPKCPTHELEGVDFVCFTDDHSLESKTWQIVKLNEKPENSRLLARQFKMHPHKLFPHAESTLWLDGLFTLYSLGGIFDSDYRFAVRKHPKRNCVFQEIASVRRRRQDRPEVLESVRKKYREIGFPSNYGLWMTGILYRRNVPAVNKFNELWWKQILGNSIRDQISLPYLLRKTDLEFSELTKSMPRCHWGNHRVR